MKYKLSREAEQDLIRTYQYGHSQFGEIQADIYYDEFFNSFERITKNPFLFPSAAHIKSGYRLCVCGSDTIYFKLNKDIVEIIAIVGRQDFK